MSTTTISLADTQLMARAIVIAHEFYLDASHRGASDFVIGQAYGELSQAVRMVRALGRFDDRNSQASIVEWAKKVSESS